MCTICYTMEFLALGVHFAQRHDAAFGTSSACYYEQNNSIYITSQTINQSMLALPALPDVKAVAAKRNVLDDWLKGQGKMTAAMQKSVKVAVPRSAHADPSRLSFKKAAGGEAQYLVLAWAEACWGVGFLLSDGKPSVAALAQDDTYQREVKQFWEKAPKIKFVPDSEIFAAGVNAENGFHGESRLLRYLAVKTLRKNLDGPLMKAKSEKPFEEQFADSFKWQLHMGSNRPACADCGKFMERIGVHFKTRNDAGSSSGHPWVHPFTLNLKKSTGLMGLKALAKQQATWKESNMHLAD